MERQPPPEPAGVVLTGYRATGKTTVGRALADLTGLRFVDLDQELAARYGAINELVARHGWEHFRALEHRLLAEFTGRSGLVIATGGGAVLHRDLWPAILDRWLVVWLQAPAAAIRQRLLADPATSGQRPSLTGGPVGDEIDTVLAQRLPLYRESCHLALDTATASPETLAAAIAKRLGRQGPIPVTN